MEEQEASPCGAPAPLNPSHRSYSTEHKHDILQTLLTRNPSKCGLARISGPEVDVFLAKETQIPYK